MIELMIMSSLVLLISITSSKIFYKSEDILILMINRDGETVVPKGSTIIEKGDVLVVTGDRLDKLKNIGSIRQYGNK